MASVVAIHLRPSPRAPVVEVASAVAREGRGLDGDHAHGGARQLTLLSLEDWTRACSELGASLDPGGRRANVVVEGLALAETVGRHVRIGRILLEITGITHPCSNMDAFQPGLRKALKPEGRGGVHGRILLGGVLARGDPVELLPRAEE